MAGWPVHLQNRIDYEIDMINLTTERGHLEAIGALRGFLATPDSKRTNIPMLKAFEGSVLILQISFLNDLGNADGVRLALRSRDLYIIGFKGLNNAEWIELNEGYKQIKGSKPLAYSGSYASLNSNGEKCCVSRSNVKKAVKILSAATDRTMHAKDIATSLFLLVFVISESVRFHKITTFIGQRLSDEWAEGQAIEPWVLEVGKHWNKMSSIVRGHKGDERGTKLTKDESIGNQMVVDMYKKELKFHDLGDVLDAIALLTTHTD